MPGRLQDDAYPTDHQCIVVDDLVTCLELGKLRLREFWAAYFRLAEHIFKCDLCGDRMLASTSTAVRAYVYEGKIRAPEGIIGAYDAPHTYMN